MQGFFKNKLSKQKELGIKTSVIAPIVAKPEPTICVIQFPAVSEILKVDNTKDVEEIIS